MMKRWTIAVVALGLALLLDARGACNAVSASDNAAGQTPASTQSSPPGGLRVTLLGTAVGPPVDVDRFGASTLVEAGDTCLLFDCGRGATIRLPAAGITIVSHDISEGIVLEENGLKVTAFLVDHGPVAPAYGYRVDYRGRSVVLSGDTRPSENLVRHAAGVDGLILEADDPVAARARSTNLALTETLLAHHSTAEQAGQIFARVKPRLAVYSHAPATEGVIEQTRKTYTGPLQGAEDLIVIDIGEQVTVRHLR